MIEDLNRLYSANGVHVKDIKEGVLAIMHSYYHGGSKDLVGIVGKVLFAKPGVIQIHYGEDRESGPMPYRVEILGMNNAYYVDRLKEDL